uniref:Uncharacterized protein n=1 Tax=uncultured Thiotrichaceae bacterium TaxID=298394 RepID=A0A6S6SQL8_9GAMM|nr:MAG: Unknown protein [uncultured Thiotrichaceae bacterium]
MQNNQNLWIGLITGAVLTGLLMYVLYQYTGASDTKTPVAEKAIPPETPFVKPKPAEVKKVTTQAISNQEKQIKVEIPDKKAHVQQPEKMQPALVVPTEKSGDTNPPNLPENLNLSEEALSKLSLEERKRYEDVLKTYRQMREQVFELNKERSQLQQQMDDIIKENTMIDQQLDQMRQGQNNN